MARAVAAGASVREVADTGRCRVHGLRLRKGFTYCWRCLAQEVDSPNIKAVSNWWWSPVDYAVCPHCGKIAARPAIWHGRCPACENEEKVR